MITKTAPMWKVGNALYHYSDKVRAESFGKDIQQEVIEVKATFPSDYFIGTWQFVETALQIETV